MRGNDRFARWPGMTDNRRGHPMKGKRTMHEEMTGRETLDPETTAPVIDPSHELESGAPSELELLKAERNQLLDRLARLQAEFDNARKREAKERADTRDYAVSNSVEPFLGVMDNFQLALKADGTKEQLRAGVELILRQMEDALKGLNVTAVES